MKHCPTRWLNLLRCIDKYLKQLQGLNSYFCTCSKQSSKVISITTRLQHTFTNTSCSMFCLAWIVLLDSIEVEADFAIFLCLFAFFLIKHPKCMLYILNLYLPLELFPIPLNSSIHWEEKWHCLLTSFAGGTSLLVLAEN